jgi:hypothetical protein
VYDETLVEEERPEIDEFQLSRRLQRGRKSRLSGFTDTVQIPEEGGVGDRLYNEHLASVARKVSENTGKAVGQGQRALLGYVASGFSGTLGPFSYHTSPALNKGGGEFEGFRDLCR